MTVMTATNQAHVELTDQCWHWDEKNLDSLRAKRKVRQLPGIKPKIPDCAPSGLPLSYDNQTFFCNRYIYVLRMFMKICGAKIFHRVGTYTKFDSSSGISVTATRRKMYIHNHWYHGFVHVNIWCESRCKVDSQMPKVCLDELELFLVSFAVTCLQVVFEYIW